MNVLDSIYKRRSIRKYQDKKVEPEKQLELLKAAMAAPSAHNTQPWHFILVDEKERIRELRSFMPYGNYNAPSAIVVCGNLEHENKKTVEAFWVQDCTSALTNILNAAVELDLATVWLGVYPIKKLVNEIIERFSVPSHIIPLAVVYVGYGAEEKEARTQYDESKISFQTMKK